MEKIHRSFVAVCVIFFLAGSFVSICLGDTTNGEEYSYYLYFDGIEGGLDFTGHKGDIEVLSFSHDVGAPMGSVSGTSADCHKDFMIMKPLDKASPKLYEAVCIAKKIKDATLIVVRKTDGHTVIRYEFDDVRITSVSSSAAEGSIPLEEVTFSYEKIEWTYTEYDSKTGKPKGDVKADWDTKTSRKR